MARKMNPRSLSALKAHAIRPGQIKNPLGVNGKNPLTTALTAKGFELLSQTAAGEKVRVALDLGPKANWYDAITERAFRMAIAGDLEAIKEISNRVEGRCRERVELSGPNGGELAVGVKLTSKVLVKTLKEIYGLRGPALVRKRA